MNTHGRDMKIFTANSNPRLAREMAGALGIPLGDSDVTTFCDGEIAVNINESVRGFDVFVVQSTSQPVNDNIMELLIMIDAFKRASAGRITAVVPYFGYSRQDRKSKARDPISARLVADLITVAGADRILTMDLHSPQIQGFFGIPVDDLQGMSILAPYFKDRFKESLDYTIAVSPDLGSVTRARNFSHRVGVGLAIIDKRRQRANVSEIMNIIGDVKDKTVIIVDDMIDTAGTLCNAAAAVIEQGGAKEVYAAATHGVLSGNAIERIEKSYIKEIVMLDTIIIPPEKKADKLLFLPVSGVFAQAVERIYMDKPISPLFN
ncbi:MAG: ribose-phosphate pyrophosphokinase [Oscillospiraceae bacterium]|jgi:ribose-phosphate pyrophosphokinase|nr:ribose-phosphate pyrophosphokinase [Oscillospiraceae bacterium]